MGPELHHWYSVTEARTAFGDADRPEMLCDGQFVVLPSVILCFITIGQTSDEPYVSSPSGFTWRPMLGTKRAGPDGDDWLPEKVREVWDRSGSQTRNLRDHHLFLRTSVDDRFFYAGPVDLASYGNAGTTSGTWGLAANFAINSRLPRDVWLKFGGYPGWLVEVNHECHRIEHGDLPSFERAAGALLGHDFSHLSMTRYEEDSLSVHTNATRGWLMYLRHPADGGVYSRDLEYRGPEESEELFQCQCGIDLQFPTAQTVPRDLARRAAVEFFQTGQLPRCIQWELE